MPKCEVIAAPSFARALHTLQKRHRSLKRDVLDLIEQLEKEPETGTPLGGGVYKIRLAIRSKHKGKRGGARVITYHLVRDGILYLLTIYDKSEQSDISDAEIDALVKQVLSDRSA